MKKAIVFLLVLTFCLTFSSCAKREYASPGRADGSQPVEKEVETNFLTRLFSGNSSDSKKTDTAKTDTAVSDAAVGESSGETSTESAEQADSDSSSGGQTGTDSSSTDTGRPSGGQSGSDATSDGNKTVERLTPTAPDTPQTPVNYDEDIAPTSVMTYKYQVGGKTVNIDYGEGMTVSEENDMAVVYAGDNMLYVDYIGDAFSSVRDNPSIFLYNYGFEHIVSMVENNFGTITGTGDDIKEAAVQDGELCRFEGSLVCGNTLVYVIASLEQLSDSNDCVIKTSVCGAESAMIFNNVEVY